MAYHSAQGPEWRPAPAAWLNLTCPTSHIHYPTRYSEGSGKLFRSHTGSDSTEVHLNGNELSAQIKQILQNIMGVYDNIEILKGKMVSSGRIPVGILGIQKENGHQRRTVHHDMGFQLAQL